MLLLLLKFLSLKTSIKIPLVFYYSSTRMILAAITTLISTILIGPYFINKLYSFKTGESIRVEACPVLAELHQKKKKTPSMGGLFILISLCFSLFLWMDLQSPFTLILFISTIWLGTIGGIDDYLKIKYKNSKGLCAQKKFGFQLIFGIIFAIYLIYPSLAEFIQHGNWFIPPTSRYGENVLSKAETYLLYFFPFIKEPIFILKGFGVIVAFIMSVLVVTGTSNAVNLTDGLDGLAAGSVLLVSLVFAVFGFLSNNIEVARYLNIIYIEGSAEIAIYMCAISGACLGFLWYNGYPAQVFMGDTGSIALGGILGTAAVLLRREFLLVLVGGVFVVEALSVILQVLSYRYRNKKRIFRCAPLHHHFEFKGWTEPKVVIRFWIIGFILALFGLASLKFQ